MKNNYTREDIKRIVEEEDVEFVRLQFVDLFGNLKNVAITVNQLDKALDNKIMFDGAAIDGFTSIEEADMYLHPDLDTFTIFPWRPQQGKVARLICDVYGPDQKPFEGDPRYILKKAIANAEKLGYKMIVGPEIEFFLFHVDDDGLPTTQTHEKGGYFDMGTVDFGENARRDIILTLEDMDFTVISSHHEMAPAQHEIDFEHDEALTIADKINTFKLAVKTVSRRHGLHATFMPKPRMEYSGSGMHINISLEDKDGKNIFNDPSDENGLSKEGYYFIGGLMKHVAGLSAITNPIVNSYKRLVPGYEAPVYVAWSAKSRSPMIRIPRSRGEVTRIEFRTPDPSTNPYLTFAACLSAGMDGIVNKITPPAAVDVNIDKMSDKEREELGIKSLPDALGHAVEALDKDEFLKNVLGEQTSKKYIDAKKNEWRRYLTQVSSWEIDEYLNRY